jgi:cation:H+ antiporter
MEYILLLVGFALLLYSGKYLVKGSVAMANYFNVSKLVIGVTVVSFGTSAPEMFVSTFANLKGHPEVAMGNIIGSNIANIALVLAITAMIIPIPVKKDSVKIDAPFMLLVSVLLFVLILDFSISVIEGVLFLVILSSYITFLLVKSRKSNNEESNKETLPLWKSIVFVLISAGGLALGSNLLVENATIIASDFGVSERVIGITVIAFGMSLPELATSVIAAIRKEMDISIGNIIGSNIFNILAVLGVSASLKSMDIAEKFVHVDIYWMLAISGLLFISILPFKGGRLTRIKGIMLFCVYCVYIYYLL